LHEPNQREEGEEAIPAAAEGVTPAPEEDALSGVGEKAIPSK
jgi:hypothetical protein